MLTKIIENYHCEPEEPLANNSDKHITRLELCFGDQKTFTDEINTFYQYLSAEEIERSKRFMKSANERTYVISHAMVNKNIAEQLGKNFYSLNINYFDNKKPYIDGNPIDFNLSHSSDYFAFAIGHIKDIIIGVDIETVRDKLNIESIVNHYFHKNEIAFILDNNLSSYVQTHRFYEVWTRKEAFLKMLGIGLIEELSEIDLSHGERDIVVQNNNLFDANCFSEIFVYTLSLPQNQIISLSTNQPVGIIPRKCYTF